MTRPISTTAPARPVINTTAGAVGSTDGSTPPRGRREAHRGTGDGLANDRISKSVIERSAVTLEKLRETKVTQKPEPVIDARPAHNASPTPSSSRSETNAASNYSDWPQPGRGALRVLADVRHPLKREKAATFGKTVAKAYVSAYGGFFLGAANGAVDGFRQKRSDGSSPSIGGKALNALKKGAVGLAIGRGTLPQVIRDNQPALAGYSFLAGSKRISVKNEALAQYRSLLDAIPEHRIRVSPHTGETNVVVRLADLPVRQRAEAATGFDENGEGVVSINQLLSMASENSTGFKNNFLRNSFSLSVKLCRPNGDLFCMQTRDPKQPGRSIVRIPYAVEEGQQEQAAVQFLMALYTAVSQQSLDRA